MTTAEVLPASEAAELAACEQVIERGLRTFLDVGQALAAIRDARLYRAAHTTFEDYCRQRWQLSARHANRTIEAARVAEILGPTGPRPANESQARELAPLLSDPDRLRDTWRRALGTSGGRPTAADIAAARDGTPRLTRAEAERRTEQIRAELHDAWLRTLAGLMSGIAPAQIAREILARWREFEDSDEQRMDAEGLSAIRRHICDPLIADVLAWPGGPFAQAIVAENDELAAMYRARFAS